TITQPPALTVTMTTNSNVTCNGGNNGSATASPNGGSAPYTYVWSNGGSSATENTLAAGTYTVTIMDAHGCTGTGSVTITQPTAIVASASSATNVTCYGGNNGTATVSPSGGTAPYTYNWSNGGTSATDNNLTAGTYTVTVKDANS